MKKSSITCELNHKSSRTKFFKYKVFKMLQILYLIEQFFSLTEIFFLKSLNKCAQFIFLLGKVCLYLSEVKIGRRS